MRTSSKRANEPARHHRHSDWKLSADPSLPASGPGAAPNGNYVLTNFLVEADGAPVKLVPRASADHSQESFAVAGLVDGEPNPWAILPEVGRDHAAIFEPTEPFTESDQTELTIRLEFKSQFAQHEIGHFRIVGDERCQDHRGDCNCLLTFGESCRSIRPIAFKEVRDGFGEAYYRSASPLRSIRPAQQLADLAKQARPLLAAAPKCLVTTSRHSREP